MPKPHDVTVSLFDGVRTAVRGAWSGSWSDFVDVELPALVAERRPTKKSLPGVILAEVDGKRDDAHTGAHTALLIDVDALPDNDLGALQKKASAYTCAVYETPSSTDEAPRVRVIVALRRPLPPEAVPAARRELAKALGLDPDRCGTAGALAASQVMFAGRLKGTRPRGLWTYEGEIYAPRKVDLGKARRVPRPWQGTKTTTAEASASTETGRGVPDLSAIAKHVPPAGQDGDRHSLVRALGGWLARRGYDPDDIAEAVREQIPASDPAERASQAHSAAERVRQGEDAPGWEALERWSEAYARGASTLRRLERQCRDPNEPKEFQGVWSVWWSENYERLAERFAERARARRLECPALDAPPPGAAQDGTGLHLHPATGWPWILQLDNFFWLHDVRERTYRRREVRTSELEASVARHMAGLLSDDDMNPRGGALKRDWVAVVDTLRSDYTARAHTYDPQTRTLTLSALRWTDRPPRRHLHIERWFRALFGALYDAAAQWIASLVALDRPAPCLYLSGGHNLGKSLLASGLAQLWSLSIPAKMKEVISDFNESTASCPLVFTDEGFPEKLNFLEFREMITEHARRVNPKNRPKLTVDGCARFIIAANNEDVLRYQKIGTLTRADLEAIGDRLLVVPCHDAAREAVNAIDTTAAASHEIAEHALWIASTVQLEPHGRMAAKPGGGERILAGVVAGRSAEVLQRIREMVAGVGELGERAGVRLPRNAKRAEAEVWVNVPRLLEAFAGRVPLTAVKECCESFALRPGTEQHKSVGENLRWRVLDRARLNEAFARLD